MINQKSILKFEIFSALFSMIFGTLLHFTFEWSNNNLFIGTFSAINESTWEHLKLIFFPMFITTIIGCFYFKDSFPNYICAKTHGIIIAMLFIIIFFYTYSRNIRNYHNLCRYYKFLYCSYNCRVYNYKKFNFLSLL